MQTLLGILIAVLVFSIMIFVHEFGHYAAARLCHVKVLEFAIGMGPKLLSHRSKKSDILYSVRLLPIGGFTAMQGEDGEDDDPHALVNRPRWQRFIVLFAGSFMNLLTGVVAMGILVALTGIVGTSVVASFKEGSVSHDWLCVGDEIVAIEGRAKVDYTDIVNSITFDAVEPIDITVIRDGEKVILENVQFATQEAEGLRYAVPDFYFQGVRPSFLTVLRETGTRSVSTVKMIYKSLADLIRGRFGIEAVSGPVGTVSVISDVALSKNFNQMLYLFSFISINLGLMNLLPLPALDGGRLLFLFVEAVIRKKLDPVLEGRVHLVGMAVLLLFMLFITIFDVIKLF